MSDFQTTQVGITTGQTSAQDGIVRSSRTTCDVFTGMPEALIAAGLITAAQLVPQPGRVPGHTFFLPSGEPCPIRQRAWREPGYKAIHPGAGGTYRVEVAVTKEVREWRRKAEHAAWEAKVQGWQKAKVSEAGDRYANWTLQQSFGGFAEFWEGTKAQFQAAGLGQGKMFPGEPGAPDKLSCKCLLGFEFKITRSSDAAKAVAGIFDAHSRYMPAQVGHTADQVVDYAPGVTRTVWSVEGWAWDDSFFGTAQALVDAGLAPGIDLFPGQGGSNRVQQASFRADWTPATNSSHDRASITIQKLGKSGRYRITRPVPEAEEQRRRALRNERAEEEKQRCADLARERQLLRRPKMSTKQLLESRVMNAEVWLSLLQDAIFKPQKDGVNFDIDEGGEVTAALELIRKAVNAAGVRNAREQGRFVRPRLTLVPTGAGRR